MMKKVTITIPATSANLGPGFDCLGVALGLYNTVTFTAGDEIVPQSANLPPVGCQISVEGVDADKVPTDKTNLVAQTATLLFDRLGKRPSSLHIHQHNNIPVGRGTAMKVGENFGVRITEIGTPEQRVAALGEGVD